MIAGCVELDEKSRKVSSGAYSSLLKTGDKGYFEDRVDGPLVFDSQQRIGSRVVLSEVTRRNSVPSWPSKLRQ